jgi:hypothetical protein
MIRQVETDLVHGGRLIRQPEQEASELPSSRQPLTREYNLINPPFRPPSRGASNRGQDPAPPRVEDRPVGVTLQAEQVVNYPAAKRYKALISRTQPFSSPLKYKSGNIVARRQSSLGWRHSSSGRLHAEYKEPYQSEDAILQARGRSLKRSIGGGETMDKGKAEQFLEEDFDEFDENIFAGVEV